ncbi:hypothetical protein TKK_0004293 [Trichogramma kaykai]
MFSTRGSAMVSLLTITMIITSLAACSSANMTCYRCTVHPPQYQGDADQPCQQFDASERFHQVCPASTFCLKRVIPYRLPNGTMTTTFERDCAPQKYAITEYNYELREWIRNERINRTAYQDGCYAGQNRGTPNGPSTYCYCSSDLCNGAEEARRPALYYALAIVAAVVARS